MRPFLSVFSVPLLVLTGLALGCAPSAPDEATESTEFGVVEDACGGAQGIGHLGHGEVRRAAETDRRVLHLALGVDDAAASRRVHAYDGSRERAFACVPVRPGPYGTGPNFRRVDLPWAETVLHEGRPVDVHRVSLPIDRDFDDPSWSWTRGVYFGFETAGGIVWAQWPGEDLTVRLLHGEAPTTRPLP